MSSSSSVSGAASVAAVDSNYYAPAAAAAAAAAAVSPATAAAAAAIARDKRLSGPQIVAHEYQSSLTVPNDFKSKINFLSLFGKCIQIECNNQDTIRMLKEKLIKQDFAHSDSVDVVRLMYGGCDLENGETVRKYNIFGAMYDGLVDIPTVHVSYRMKGAPAKPKAPNSSS